MVMNATRTTLIDVPWRWQRGIARALLLAGALAAMTSGTVAQAQIAFRAASSATHPVPTFGAASSAAAWPPGADIVSLPGRCFGAGIATLRCSS
jgi:hypothetical protein